MAAKSRLTRKTVALPYSLAMDSALMSLIVPPNASDASRRDTASAHIHIRLEDHEGLPGTDLRSGNIAQPRWPCYAVHGLLCVNPAESARLGFSLPVDFGTPHVGTRWP
jgi:hypothetical protein